MAQNRSSAVMQQRKEPHDSLDYFPTPPWATRALCEHVLRSLLDKEHVVLEPACGQGHMANVLKEYSNNVVSSDVHDYGYGDVADFLFPTYEPPEKVDWIITNPPFNLGEQFIDKALEIAINGVAVLVRSSFIETIGRYERLFRDRRPSRFAQFSERVPMFKGCLDPKGTTATSYCWIVWGHDIATFDTQLRWIPPCRKQLERAGDYDER